MYNIKCKSNIMKLNKVNGTAMRQLNRRGMTLIEVVVAIAIFGIVMVTIFPAILVLNLMNTYSYEKLDATSIAQEAMEELIFESRSINLASYQARMVAMGYVFQSDSSNPTRFVYHKESPNYTIIASLTRRETTNLYNLNIIVRSPTNEIAGDRVQLETIISLN